MSARRVVTAVTTITVAVATLVALSACGREMSSEKLVLYVMGKAPMERVELTLSVPKGWNYIKHDETRIGDGLDGYIEAADPNASADQQLLVTGWFCGGATQGCEAASFGTTWSWQFGGKDAATDITEVAPGVRMASDHRKDFPPSVWVQHLVAGTPPMIVECQATVAIGKVPGDLAEACQALVVGARTPTFSDAVDAAERAKLGACPGTSAVEYVSKKRDAEGVPVFGPATRIVLEASYNQVDVGLLTNPLGLNPFEQTGRGRKDLKDGQTALWLSIDGARGADVVSGSYPISAGPAGVVRSLVIAVGGKDDDNLATHANGAVEVIARTRDHICGRFTWEDRERRVSGTFDGPLTAR